MQRQTTSLVQTGALSQQQILFIKMLALPLVQLEQRIKQELEDNPALDEAGGEDFGDDQQQSTDDQQDDAGADDAELDERDLDLLREYEEDAYGYKAPVDGREEQPERPVPLSEGLFEQLIEQIHLVLNAEEEWLIAEQILGSVDPDGYLRRPTESIVDELAFSYGTYVEDEAVERVIKTIQHLDPPGIASRSLQECLTVQLETSEASARVREIALQIVTQHFEDLAQRRFDRIVKRTGVDEQLLRDGLDLILRLNPKPGDGLVSAAENYVLPDVSVVRDEEDFVVEVRNASLPRLKISPAYLRLYDQMAAKNQRLQPGTRKFLKEKIDSARWFMGAVQKRQDTLQRVVHEMVQLQIPFFRHGEGHLTPMVLKDIADRVSLDISTVSRIIKDKYVQTEFGSYPLKYFFSEGIKMASGEVISNRDLQSQIGQIIAAEDKREPLSDQKICEMLAREGIHIARRTVTKYREKLNLPSAHLRRDLVVD